MYSIDGFLHRLNTTSFPEQKELGKEDYVIICGDFGGIWDVDRFRVQESPSEKAGLDWLEQKPFTTLFIPGNHENYDRLNRYLESLRGIMKYDKWFYGHLHDNRRVFENNFLLYEQIIRIN